MKKINGFGFLVDILLVIWLNACAPAPKPLSPTPMPLSPLAITFTPLIIPTPTATITPIHLTATITPTATASIYKSDDLGITFEYPKGWFVSSPDQGFIEIASKEFLRPMQEIYGNGEIVMEIIGVPSDLHALGDPFAILYQFTSFMGTAYPDKEPAHAVNLNGRDFVIGTCSEDLIKEVRGNRVPLFIAVYYSDQKSLVVDMYVSPSEELQLRKVFENLLVSIQEIQ